MQICDYNLKTSRCTLRPFAAADIDAFMLYRNDEHWMRYQGFKGKTKEEYAQVLLGEVLLVAGAQFAIVENATNRLIGDVYLQQDSDTFWVGYTIAPAFARQGYAFEVVGAVVQLLKDLGKYHIKAGVETENIASIALLQKLGFQREGVDESGEEIYFLP